MPEFLLAIFQVMIVITLPLMVSRILQSALHKFAHEEFFQVPILATVAKLQGILAGIMLIRLDVDRQYFDFEQMFLSGGPWDLTLPQFLWERANLFVYNPFYLIGLLRQVPSEDGIVAGLVVIVLPLLVLIVASLLWEFKEVLRSLVASGSIALWTSWLTIYIVSAIFWLLHLLNFWSLILLLLYLQYRYDRNNFQGWWTW